MCREWENRTMPIYEYDCVACGDFTALRPMAERDKPCACPECGGDSLRVILTAPQLATMSSNQRRAMAANETSSHAPKTVEEFAQSRKHPKGCGCCGPSKPLAPTKENPHAMQAKAGGRPWMISH